MQPTVRPEAAPDDAWGEALVRAARAAARSISASVAARLAAQDASCCFEPQPSGMTPGEPPPDAADGGAAGGGLPEFKTLAEDDLEAGLALQAEVSSCARWHVMYAT